MTIKHLRCDQQARCSLNEEIAVEYRDLWAAGSEPPPVTVVRVDGQLRLADGNHRVRAAALMTPPRTKIYATVTNGTEMDLLQLMGLCNRNHGLRFNQADKANLIGLHLRHTPNLSNDVIANAVGVTDQTIENHRPKYPGAMTRHRIGLDGLTRYVGAKRTPTKRGKTEPSTAAKLAPGGASERAIRELMEPIVLVRAMLAVLRPLNRWIGQEIPVVKKIEIGKRAPSRSIAEKYLWLQSILPQIVGQSPAEAAPNSAGLPTVVPTVAGPEATNKSQRGMPDSTQPANGETIAKSPRPNDGARNAKQPIPGSGADIARRLISGEIKASEILSEKKSSAVRTEGRRRGWAIARRKVGNGFEMTRSHQFKQP